MWGAERRGEKADGREEFKIQDFGEARGGGKRVGVSAQRRVYPVMPVIDLTCPFGPKWAGQIDTPCGNKPSPNDGAQRRGGRAGGREGFEIFKISRFKISRFSRFQDSRFQDFKISRLKLNAGKEVRTRLNLEVFK